VLPDPVRITADAANPAGFSRGVLNRTKADSFARIGAATSLDPAARKLLLQRGMLQSQYFFEETPMRSGLLRSDSNSQKERLVADLSDMVTRAESLLKEAGSEVQGRLGNAKARLGEAGTVVSDKARYAADATDAYVRDNPWKVLGMAAAVGALLALLLTTRR
jgi:ElaB/YqjD/DUF883 family membrane-anchored ribosome-binding protein